MFLGLFALLVPITIIGGVIYGVVVLAQHGRPAAPPRADTHPTRRGRSDPDELDRWVGAGLISDQQRQAIISFEVGPPEVGAPEVGPPEVGVNRPTLPTPPIRLAVARSAGQGRRIPPVAEALGYLGGVLAIIGLTMLVSKYWTDMATGGRLAMSGGAAIALLAGGALVREEADPALARLRWFVWTVATAATALFVLVLTRDAFDANDNRIIALTCVASIAALNAALWWWRERPIQQLVCLVAVVVAVGLAVAEWSGDGYAGMAVWVLGGVLLAAGLRQLTPLSVITEAVGAIAFTLGGAFIASDWEGFGLVIVLLSSLALLAVTVVPGLAPNTPHVVIAAVVGGFAFWQGAPQTVAHFANNAGLVTGFAVWLGGAGLIVIGGTDLVRVPILAEVFGSIAIIVGAAVTAAQFEGFGPLFGIATAILLVALGMLPGRVLMSVAGSVGLLINVPWAISYYFPGEGRVPLLILVSGALVLTVAVLLARMGDRFRSELGGRHERVRHNGRHRGAPPSPFTPMPL